MVSEDSQLDRVLIRAYQYVIARFDCDGFRIDNCQTLPELLHQALAVTFPLV
jgi:hypothetical protein